MSSSWGAWLAEAGEVLGDQRSDEHAVDAIVADGLALPPPDAVDPMQMQRVLACLTARRAALAAELADIARRRSDLLRARTGATGYLNAPLSVPME